MGRDELVSGLQLGYIAVYGMQVGSNFGSFDASGVAGFARGGGNHCMHADGVKKLPDGRWVLDNVNSWGYSWGPWKNGRCYLSESHIKGADNSDAYLIKGAVDDPSEPIKPPKVSINPKGTYLNGELITRPLPPTQSSGTVGQPSQSSGGC